MVGSNNYLGLADDPRVVSKAEQCLLKYGSGCTGSRFLNGTLDIHVELEEKLAAFEGKQSALCFSTGFTTNCGTVSTLPQRGDVIIADKRSHASLMDGFALSAAKLTRFAHNDVAHLETLLEKHASNTAGGTFVVTEGMFSMEGDLSPLDKIVPLVKKYGARIMVDEAHSVGIMGPGGRGTAEECGVLADTDIIMGTFSKSFASMGGFIAGDDSVISYVKHNSRFMIFSAAMSPAAVGACLASLEIMQTEPERRVRVRAIADRVRAELKRIGFNLGHSTTPVVPIVIGDKDTTFLMWRWLLDHGLYCNPVIPPAVDADACLLRTSYMATHTDEQLDRVVELFGEAGRHFKVIP